MSAVPPEHRHHDLYFEDDEWTVCDVDDVDKVFATRTGEDGGVIRIDLDGRAAASNEVVEKDEPVNMSVWLSPEQLAEIVAKSEVDLQ